MYRQILIEPTERKYQCIWWLYEDTIRTFALNTVTFGVSAAPFHAIRTLHQLADDERVSFPRASLILKNNFYVDDFIGGAATKEELCQIKSELTMLLSKGGFSIRKWVSNCDSVSNESESWTFSNQDKEDVSVELGIRWTPLSDEFSFKVKLMLPSENLTKRAILSAIASIFNPMELLGPVILTAKIIMQDCWKAKLGWDESVSLQLFNSWNSFANELHVLDKILIPRHFLVTNPIKIELHGFCDASIHGYGARVYARSIDSSGEIRVRLMCSKSRVAPVKSITIPRLELCGALLLATLISDLKESFSFPIDSISLWSDSEIVLQWIKKAVASLKVFEGNRVGKIQKLTVGMEWHHVPGKDNPADALSRGQFPMTFIRNKTWFTGPPWLGGDKSNWPRPVESSSLLLPGLKESKCMIMSINEPAFYKNFSSYSRLINVVAYMFRWRDRTQIGNLTIFEKDRAERALLKIVQREQFQDQIDSMLKKNETKKPSFAILDPFLDAGDLMRVGGRLRNATIGYDQRHQILLPSFHHVTDLIIKQNHLKTLHAGVQGTLYTIRQKFWILDGKNQVRRVIRRCITCLRYKPNVVIGKMGDMPKARVEQVDVFARVGIDYCGPFDIKEKKFRNRVILKAYCCVFVCMATKAIHLEIVSDMTTEAFINALRRFISRRGIPTDIYSDNGSNFIGARNQLKEIFKLTRSASFQTSINEFAYKNQIRWHFNPPLSPHFDGIWEAAVKSFKHHLKRVVGGQVLTFEQLTTLTAEVESILNSRPISSMSSDPNDPAALTPSHFLIGRPINSLPDSDSTELPNNRLPNWKFIIKAKQDFWSRWHLEYLTELQKRLKWTKSKGDITIDTVVIIIDKNIPCHQWPLGRVIDVHPGIDGVVRVVSVKIRNEVYKRNITSLCPLPTNP